MLMSRKSGTNGRVPMPRVRFSYMEKFIIYFILIAGLNIHEAFNEDDSGSVEKAIAKLVEEAKKRRREKERPAKKRIGVVS